MCFSTMESCFHLKEKWLYWLKISKGYLIVGYQEESGLVD